MTDYMMLDAADAIEELDAEETRLLLITSELQDKVFELEEQLNDADIAADDNGRQVEELQAEVKRLQAQLPKREEVWKDVIGYEGLYQVSDQARVRNNKGKILKQSVKVGKCVYYKYVKLYKDGQYRQGYVHRMMAECFIPNPDNLPIINHKDEDGTNNRLDNLEWCTVEYNSNYGNAKRNMSRGKRRRAKMEVQE